MSLYNMINGVNPCTFFVLPVLGKHPDTYPRFRNCFVGDPERPETTGKIIVYTRTGGGNRESYAEENKAIQEMPGFLFDYDDDFDSTFANWVFDVPEQWRKDVAHIIAGEQDQLSPEYVDLCMGVYPKIADKLRPHLGPQT